MGLCRCMPTAKTFQGLTRSRFDEKCLLGRTLLFAHPFCKSRFFNLKALDAIDFFAPSQCFNSEAFTDGSIFRFVLFGISLWDIH